MGGLGVVWLGKKSVGLCSILIVAQEVCLLSNDDPSDC